MATISSDHNHNTHTQHNRFNTHNDTAGTKKCLQPSKEEQRWHGYEAQSESKQRKENNTTDNGQAELTSSTEWQVKLTQMH